MARSDKKTVRPNRSDRAVYQQNSNGNLKILSIFFVLAGLLIIVRLFWLQVIKYDYYLAKARSQHEFNVQLAPTRGQIFVHNGKSGVGNDLYPVATNRRFFTLYTVPRDLQMFKIEELRNRQSKTNQADRSFPVIVEPIVLAEILFEVGRDKFYPAPEVDSAVIRIKPMPNRLKSYEEEKKTEYPGGR